MLISNFSLGNITLKPHKTQSGTWLSFNLTELNPSTMYIFNIYTYGDLTYGIKLIGDHWNPYKSNHGVYSSNYYDKRDPYIRHAGDLRNFTSDTYGNLKYRYYEPLVKCSDVVGRSIVIRQHKTGKVIGYAVIGYKCL